MTVDDLSVVVSHMKKQTGYVKTTNQELSKFNEGQAGQNKWLRVISLLLTVFLCVLGYGLWLDHQDAAALTAEIVKTNARLDVVVRDLKDTYQAAEDTKRAVEKQPIITVEPVDTANPAAGKVLVVQPKPVPLPPSHVHKGDPPPAPKGVKIPIPRKEKPKK